MDEIERLARTVAEQRTGDEGRWREFIDRVKRAIEAASRVEGATARDFLDEPE